MTFKMFQGEMPNGNDIHILIDFRNFLHRAALARSGMSKGQDLCTSTGMPSGHIYRGFTMLRSLKKEYGGQFVVVFEGVKNFRYKLYPEYKGNRDRSKLVKTASIVPDGSPGPVSVDFDPTPDMIEMLSHMKCKFLTPHGGEADDGIATFVKNTKGRHIVVSTDRDLWYLLKNPKVTIVGFDRKEITKEQVRDIFHCPPSRVPMVKALFGDSGDNILNVPGLGEKKLANADLQKIIKKSANIEQLLAGVKSSANIDVKIRDKVAEHEDQVRLMYRIARLKQNVKHKIAILPGDAGKLRKLLLKFECKSLLNDAGFLTT